MTQPAAPRFDLTSGGLLVLLATVWGGSFFAGKIALAELPPMTIALHRVVWAAPVLGLLLWLRGTPLPTAPRIWGGYLVMGALNNAIPFSLIFWGQTRIDVGLAAILNGTTAMLAAVVAGLLLADEPLTGRKIAGAALGLAGVAAIMGPGVLGGFDPTNLAQLAILGGALSYAFAGVWGKTALAGQPPLANACGMLLGSSVLLVPLVVLVDGPPQLVLAPQTWAALASLALLSTALAYTLYFQILRRAGAANLLLVTLLVPPVAIALGVVFLGERMGPEAWVGFGIIAAGFAVTDGRLLDRVRRKRPAAGR